MIFRSLEEEFKSFMNTLSSYKHIIGKHPNVYALLQEAQESLKYPPEPPFYDKIEWVKWYRNKHACHLKLAMNAWNKRREEEKR